MFGNGEFTVIALHHQWLYGRSAIVNVKNMFDITEQETASSSNPFSKEVYTFNIEDYIRKVMTLVQVQFNPLHPRGIGIEGMTFLNSENFDVNGKYDSRWDMRKNPMLGDNNDGITIIDTIEKKYCLMNIFDPINLEDEGYEDYKGIHLLPSEVPVSAIDYAKAYYPSQTDIKENNEVCDILKDYEVLTLTEIRKIFPGVFK